MKTYKLTLYVYLGEGCAWCADRKGNKVVGCVKSNTLDCRDLQKVGNSSK